MAASKEILFWTPRGQLLRKQRTIPVTNISELLEYVLLPHNDDIVKPRALKTFIVVLAELGINMRLIQEKEQAYHDKDSEAVDKEMVSESSNNEDDTESASEISDQEPENLACENSRPSSLTARLAFC